MAYDEVALILQILSLNLLNHLRWTRSPLGISKLLNEWERLP